MFSRLKTSLRLSAARHQVAMIRVFPEAYSRSTSRWAGLCAVIPALDEEGSIGTVVSGLRERGVPTVIVGDNGSRDDTVARARSAGATVVHAARRGYGSACLAALAALPEDCKAVVFCDGDGADDLERLADIVDPVLDGRMELVIGSRVLGVAEAGALTPPQRMGNLVAASMMRLLFKRNVTDLGPFRCISMDALGRLGMRDPDFGWTAEMQTKAYRLNLRVLEVPVDAKNRLAGESKVSGRLIPVFRAGWGIISTIVKNRVMPIRRATSTSPSPTRSPR